MSRDERRSTKAPHDRPWIDAGEFARRGSRLAATRALRDFERLRGMLADDGGSLDWELSGERRPRPEGGSDLFLRLRLGGAVSLRCTRCLEPVAARIDEVRLFKLALTESQAEREDADAQTYDVLADSPRLDVLELVEDEAIMALPIAPRHADCTLPAGGATAHGDSPVDRQGEPPAPEARENPFGVLAALRPRRRGRDDA